jgi:hypothetical protein
LFHSLDLKIFLRWLIEHLMWTHPASIDSKQSSTRCHVEFFSRILSDFQVEFRQIFPQIKPRGTRRLQNYSIAK